MVGENEGQFAELKEHVAKASSSIPVKETPVYDFARCFAFFIILNTSVLASIMAGAGIAIFGVAATATMTGIQIGKSSLRKNEFFCLLGGRVDFFFHFVYLSCLYLSKDSLLERVRNLLLQGVLYEKVGTCQLKGHSC